ncbi:GntR family transcriptional regulator [Bacillus sp. FJAT-22090]|uniref:GntR family transcriptional regulator n=1 Tax=Bacillus sp. FJAT-22090 TaxID=1581038 RepID=UPI00164255E9|nr:GntR family transcriptional regulator [Bacillus sp. FJAT-22090]
MRKISAHQRIYEAIIEDINLNKYLSGDVLPSESEMEKLFAVSRTPIRQALKQLENDGYIYKQQGKGSIVADRKPQEDWINMSGFRESYNLEWGKISAKTIDLQIKHSSEYSSLFNTTSNDVIYLQRIRYLDEKPIFYMEHYISIDIPYSIFEENLHFSSIQQLLVEQTSIRLITAEDTIEAVIADEFLSEQLQVTKGTPLLRGSRISQSDTQRVFNVDIFYTLTDKWKYKSTYSYN